MGLIIDTGYFIRAERENRLEPAQKALPTDEPLGISVVTASELLEGVHQADNEVRRQRRIRFIGEVFRTFSVFPFGFEMADKHAELRARLRMAGKMIGAHDLIIAATAVHLGGGVLTTNRSEFARIDGLRIVDV